MNCSRMAQVAMYMPSCAQPCGTLVVCDLQGTHACTHKEDREHGAEGDGTLCVLHGVRQEVPLPACQFFHSDCNPDEDVANEELHCEVDHALHCHRDRRRVL